MTMRTSSNPPPRGTLPPPILAPMVESIARGKNEAQTVTLICGRRHVIGNFSVMYFGVIDDKAMMDVRRDGSFMGDIHVSAGQSGYVNAHMEGKRIVVDVMSADTRKAEARITIADT